MPKQRSAVVRRVAVVGLAVLFWLASVSLPTAQAQSATGAWQLGPTCRFFPVHDHVLPDGRVMMWPGDEGINGDDARAWDPAGGTVTPLGKAGFDIFCSGHSFLPDGRLFVAGGHISNGVGLANASIYSPTGNTWQSQPQMNLGRWYPTTTVLANGDVLVVSGGVDASTGATRFRRSGRPPPGPGAASPALTSSIRSIRTCSSRRTAGCSTPDRASPPACSTPRAPVAGPWWATAPWPHPATTARP